MRYLTFGAQIGDIAIDLIKVYLDQAHMVGGNIIHRPYVTFTGNCYLAEGTKFIKKWA